MQFNLKSNLTEKNINVLICLNTDVKAIIYIRVLYETWAKGEG